MELGELILRSQDDKVTFNIFIGMLYHNENPQYYRVDVVEEVVGEVSQSESSFLPLKWAIVNSINKLRKDIMGEVEECVCFLESS